MSPMGQSLPFETIAAASALPSTSDMGCGDPLVRINCLLRGVIMVERPNVVEFFPGDHPQVVSTARGQLTQRRQTLLEALIHAEDWPDFTKRRGKIEGLDEAIYYIEQAEKELNKR
jgi:hypothetical protein